MLSTVTSPFFPEGREFWVLLSLPSKHFTFTPLPHKRLWASSGFQAVDLELLARPWEYEADPVGLERGKLYFLEKHPETGVSALRAFLPL